MIDVLAEHHAVREEAGLIDRSEVGKLAIIGKDRYLWLQGMVSNDVRLLTQPERDVTTDASLPACILNATGHIMTDLTLIDVKGATKMAEAMGLTEPDFVLLDLPRVNVSKIATLLDRFLITEEVEIVDVTDKLGCLSIQGPAAKNVIANGVQTSLFDGAARGLITAGADHTGSNGIDIYFAMQDSPKILRRGAPFITIGVEAQEMLRIEAGIPKYGAELDESVIALEANLGPTHISLTKGCYLGQEIVARIDSRGHTNRALTGLIFATGQIPHPGDKIFAPAATAEATSRETGRITSVITASPALEGRPIALAYVRHEHREPGTLLQVGEAGIEARVSALPFLREEGRGKREK
jgi:folate-binding protein YgfZ